MALTVSTELLEATTSNGLKSYRDYAATIRNDREVEIKINKLEVSELEDLITAARRIDDNKTARAVESIVLARAGKFDKPVPNFKAFQGMLEAFLKADHIDGWIYVTGDDGKLYPELVKSITYDSGMSHGRQGTPLVRIHTTSYGFSKDGNYKSKFGVYQNSHVFEPQSVARRRLTDILSEQGIYKETAALRAAHMASLERHYQVTQAAFAKQFRLTGPVNCFEEDNYRRRGTDLSGRRVIHDLEGKDYGAVQRHAESYIFDDDNDAGGLGSVPEHPIIKVFDLRSHEFLWVHGDHMEPYVYDKSLREKLILPASHRDLLDVLTTNLGAFVNDFIEGKSAGNVILCKGIPGVGKTLSAETYAELIERPLFAIHSGSLGTSAAVIEKNLKVIFQRGKRWDCVLLLDEADVFVAQRGDNIEQNAIVAEFLRTLEYFDGLLFMTSNRSNDIDEAIVSRCAAIIEFVPPSPSDAAAIWRVMAEQYKISLGEALIDQLVELFPAIAPRDIKMLLRLALRISVAQNEELTLATFRRCAMFRAIKMRAESVDGRLE